MEDLRRVFQLRLPSGDLLPGIAPAAKQAGAFVGARIKAQLEGQATRNIFRYKDFGNRLSTASGFTVYWDSTAHAPYAYNAAQKTFATFDDKRSIEAKTNYVLQHHLGGIMFWQLGDDAPQDGLLQTIHQILQAARSSNAK